MKQKIIICKNCCESVVGNPRLKGKQKYCGKKSCQNVRKRLWYQARLKSDTDYAKRQKACKKRWRKNKPVHKYQHQYRQTHAEYTNQNSERQRERNKKRKLDVGNVSQKIVKIDTLTASLDPARVYEMKILNSNMLENIVKIDTLLVQFKLTDDKAAQYSS